MSAAPSLRRLAPVLALVLLTPGPAAAQFVWNNAAGGNWNTGTNWLGGSAPPSAAGAALRFGDPTAFSAGYTAANNLGPFTFTTLEFASQAFPNVGTTAAPVAPVVASGDVNNPLRLATFGGNTPRILQNGSGAAGIGGFMELVNNTTLGGSGVGLLSFGPLTGSAFAATTLSGSGNLTIDRSVNSPFRTGGYTVLNPLSTASYTGTVFLTNGNLVLGGSQPIGSGGLTVNAGTNSVQFGTTNVQVAGNVQLNGTLTLAGAIGGTFTGQINGSGGVTIAPTVSAPSTNASYVFRGANGFTGPVVIRPFGGGLGTATFSGDGTARSSSGYTVHTSGSLVLDNATSNVVNRLNSAATLTLHGGGFRVTGNTAVAAAESLAVLRTTGQGDITVLGTGTPSAGTTTTVTFGSWDRQQNSTAQISSPTLGASSGQNAAHVVFTSNPGGAVGGAGGAGTVNRAILPYVVASAGNGSGLFGTNGNVVRNFARYDAATGRIVPLFDTDSVGATGLEYARNPYALADTTSQANVKATDQIGGLNGATTVNSLVLQSNYFAGTTYSAASVGGTGTLTVSGGAILSNATSDAPAGGSYVSPGLIATQTLAFGSQTGYVHTYSDLAITAEVTGSGGLVKAGPGALFLTRTNSFTGGLTINGGAVVVTDQTALGTGPLALNGGGIAFVPVPTLNDGTQTTFTFSRPVTLGPAGGGLSTQGTDSTLAASGVISGDGQLGIGAGGLVRLTGANTHTGGTLVGQSTLAISGESALGTGNLTLINSSTLQADASFSLNRSILLQGFSSVVPNAGMMIFTNGNDVSIGGVITSGLGTGTGGYTPTGTLHKVGLGTLNLSATNTYTGLTHVGDLAPTVRVGNPSAAQTGGTLLLSGPNGAIPLSAGVNVNPGSTLILDYAFANPNRVGSVPVTLRGGSLFLLGLTGANTAESLGTLTVAGGVGTIVLGQPTGNGSIVLSLGGLAVDAANPGIAVLRGDSLGGSSGRFTQIQFGTAPTLVGGIIPFAVGGAAASAGPTGFVTVGATGAQLLGSYGSLAAPGTGVNADQSGGTFTLTGATSLNALRLGSAGGVDLNGNTLTIGSATQAGAILAAGGANAGLTGGTIAFGTRTASITAVNDLTISSALTGTAGLVKAGTGVLTLSGSGTGLAGPVVVGEGTLRLGATGALPTAAAVTLNAGATLDLNGLPGVALGPVGGFGGVSFGGSTATLTYTGTGSTVLGGPLSGGGTLSKAGTGTLVLAGNNSAFSGDVAILNGLLQVDTPTALGTATTPILIGSASATAAGGNGLSIGRFVETFSRDISVQPTATASPAVLNTTQAGAVTISSAINLNNNTLRLVGPSLTSGLVTDPTANLTGAITGAGGLEIQSGTFRLAGANTYAGGTVFPSNASIQGSLVGVATDGAFGTGPIALGTPSSTFNAPDVVLRADGGARTIANPITYVSNTELSVVGTNPLTLSGAINLGGNIRTLLSTNTAVTTLSGVLSNGGLDKQGIGAVVLTNPNSTATGGLSVGGGLLIVNGAVPSTVTVGVQGVSPPSRGGVLGGTGTVGTIDVVGGVISPGGDPLAPGNGVGVLTANGNLTVASTLVAGTFRFDLNGATPGTGHDQLVVGLAGQASSVQLRSSVLVTTLGFDPTGSTLLLIDNRGTSPITQTFAGLAEGATLSVGQFAGTEYLATISYLGGTGNDVVLSNFQPVPEPGLVLLVAAAGLVARRRRK